MKTPNWFYAIVAACAIAATGVYAYSTIARADSRWQRVDAGTVFDRQTGRTCALAAEQQTMVCYGPDGSVTRHRMQASR